MKTRLILLIAIAFSTLIKAQTTDTSFNYNDDYVLRKIIPALPQGWTFSQKPGEFIIERTDSVLEGDKRLFKIPVNRKMSDDSVLKFGTKTKSIIVYKYDTRWTYEQTLKANSNNTQIYQLLKKLPEKFNITKLVDKSKTTRGNIVYTGKTDEEKKLVIAFEKERNELLAKLVQMPNYHTEKYSLFLYSTQGCDDDYFTIYPSSASYELYTIITLVSELTEKSGQK
jgi:hypothetical protein